MKLLFEGVEVNLKMILENPNLIYGTHSGYFIITSKLCLKTITIIGDRQKILSNFIKQCIKMRIELNI